MIDFKHHLDCGKVRVGVTALYYAHRFGSNRCLWDADDRGADRKASNFNRLPPPPIPPQDRSDLLAAYRENILKLQDLIGR